MQFFSLGNSNDSVKTKHELFHSFAYNGDFFVYADTTLGANYTIWGKITKGLDIVQYIAKQGAITKDANGQLVYTGDGFTAQPVQIKTAKVS